MVSSSAYSSSVPIQSICITKVSDEAKPTPHLVYHIRVDLPVKSYSIQRRYSQFIDLNQQLSSINPNLPLGLPPKHSVKKLIHSISTLGGWLPAISTSTSTSTSDSGFLDINSKDQDDVRLLRERKSGLEHYLKALLISKDPIWRDSKAFKDFLEVHDNYQFKNQNQSQSHNNQDRPQKSEAALRLSQKQQQQPQSQQATNHSTPVRTLGRPPSEQYQETSQTRHLDDRDLFQSQSQQFQKQDEQLNGLAEILKRQRNLGLTMNQELAEQNELLNQLDAEVDVTKGKMHAAENKMSRLENKK